MLKDVSVISLGATFDAKVKFGSCENAYFGYLTAYEFGKEVLSKIYDQYGLVAQITDVEQIDHDVFNVQFVVDGDDIMSLSRNSSDD